jgi:hypothetical protein
MSSLRRRACWTKRHSVPMVGHGTTLPGILLLAHSRCLLILKILKTYFPFVLLRFQKYICYLITFDKSVYNSPQKKDKSVYKGNKSYTTPTRETRWWTKSDTTQLKTTSGCGPRLQYNLLRVGCRTWSTTWSQEQWIV